MIGDSIIFSTFNKRKRLLVDVSATESNNHLFNKTKSK